MYLTDQALPILQAVATRYWLISIVHFDSRLDTLFPTDSLIRTPYIFEPSLVHRGVRICEGCLYRSENVIKNLYRDYR